MSTGLTSRLGFPYPVNTDTAAIASDMQGMADFCDTYFIPYSQSASATPPTTTISGSFWWCTNSGSTYYGLNYYDGSSWHLVSSGQTAFSGIASARSTVIPSPVIGNFYWATDTSVLTFYTGSAWITVGSNVVNGQDIAIATINTWQSVATLTPPVNGLYQVVVCFDVASGTPTVGAQALFADANGAQTITLTPTGSSLSVGPWSSLSALISAHTGTAISLQVQASTTTGITASGFIEAV
jgi:hypothetical protein